MTGQRTGAAADRADEARGAVLQDEGAALSSVDDGEAIALPSVGGLLRGVAVTFGQVRPVSREATRLAAGGAASRLVDELGAGSADWHDVERARFAVKAHGPLEPAPGASVLDRVP